LVAGGKHCGARFAVMMAVITVVVVATIRWIGMNANPTFSSLNDSIAQSSGLRRLPRLQRPS